MLKYDEFINENNFRKSTDALSKFGIALTFDNFYNYVKDSDKYIIKSYSPNLPRFYIVYKTDFGELSRFSVFTNYENKVQIRDDHFGDSKNVTLNKFSDLDAYIEEETSKRGEYDYINGAGDAVRLFNAIGQTIQGEYYDDLMHEWTTYYWDLNGKNKAAQSENKDIYIKIGMIDKIKSRNDG